MTNYITTFTSGQDYYFHVNYSDLFYLNIENLKKKDNIFEKLREIGCNKLAEENDEVSPHYDLFLKTYQDSNGNNHYLFSNFKYTSQIVTIVNEFKIKKYIDHEKSVLIYNAGNYDCKLYIEFGKIGILPCITYNMYRSLDISSDWCTIKMDILYGQNK